MGTQLSDHAVLDFIVDIFALNDMNIGNFFKIQV